MTGATFANLVGVALALPPLLADMVPGDAVAAYFVDAPADVVAGNEAPPGSTQSAFAIAGRLADGASQFGLLSKADASTRLWVDILAATSDLLGYPHAGVLLDIRAAPRADGGHRLERFSAALILRPGGSHADIERRIQRLLNTHTNSSQSTLTCPSKIEAAPCALADRRLPSWATLTWGPAGNDYVIAIGKGAFQRVADTLKDRSKSLGVDPWFTRAFATTHGAEATLTCYASFDALCQGSDSLFTEKVGRVLSALRLEGTDRGLWTIGRRGRAVEAHGFVRRNGGDEPLPIAGTRLHTGEGRTSLARGLRGRSAALAQVIPDQATGYAIIDCNPRTVIAGLCEAYLATRSPPARHGSLAFWHDLQARAGVSIDDDILAHLGARGSDGPPDYSVVIHDYPRHALRLPLAWTILIRIGGDPHALRQHIDKLLSFGRKELAKAGGIQLLRDADGVWYTQFGLMGPALAVTDQWLVISFSPVAVRMNIACLKPAAPPASEAPSDGG